VDWVVAKEGRRPTVLPASLST